MTSVRDRKQLHLVERYSDSSHLSEAIKALVVVGGLKFQHLGILAPSPV